MAEPVKKLGKLSLAILENFVEGVLGEKFVAELYEPTGRALAIIGALEESEKLFVAKYNDKDLSKALFVDMKQSDQPVLREAVGKYFDHPTDPSLRQSLQEILFDEFKSFLSKERIDWAVDFYIKLLTKELMLKDDVFRDNIAALAIVDTNLLEQRQVELLEQIAEKIVNQQVASQQIFRSLHQLPPPPADFTGREQLITDLLEDFNSHKGATISGLTGMGGIGKTALGLAVAHQIAKNYPDAQIFLDLKGTTAPLSAMDIARHVILSFEPSVDLRALDENNMQAVYQSVLNEKRVLLFFDNARSAEQIAKLTPPEKCAMLVTSRWVFSVPGLQSRRVDVMSEFDSKGFLLELCSRVGDKAVDLAKACSYLPLALRIAGSFLYVNSEWSVEKYLSQISDRKRRLETLKHSRAEAELTTEPDLLATFELSYNSLSEENQKHWRLLGIFPAPFDANATQAVWKLEKEETTRLLGLLRRYNLLEFDEILSRYSLHDLLGDYALSQIQIEEGRVARVSHAQHYLSILLIANQLYLAGKEKTLTGLRLLDNEWQHIIRAQSWVSDNGILELGNEYPNAGYAILSLRLHPRVYISWLENGLNAARSLGYRNYEGHHIGNLGSVYAALGNMKEAIEFREKQLKIVRELGDRKTEGATLNNLGNAYEALGDAKKAIDFHEQSLVIARELGERRNEGSALSGLGSAYVVLGEPEKALEFHRQQLVIARELGERRNEGSALGSLGNAYMALSDYKKAINFYEESLVITRELGDRRGEGISLGNLGVAYKNSGDTKKSIIYYERQLVIARELGDRRTETAALMNLGNAFAILGDARKAIGFYEQALVIVQKIGDQRGEGNTLFNLALSLHSLEEKEKAIDMVKQAQKIFLAIESPNAEKARNKLKEWDVEV